jgi:hypothetical protein
MRTLLTKVSPKPPVMSTLPLRSRVAVWEARGVVMLPVAVKLSANATVGRTVINSATSKNVKSTIVELQPIRILASILMSLFLSVW